MLQYHNLQEADINLENAIARHSADITIAYEFIFEGNRFDNCTEPLIHTEHCGNVRILL